MITRIAGFMFYVWVVGLCTISTVDYANEAIKLFGKKN
jgi:hypothetical protein